MHHGIVTDNAVVGDQDIILVPAAHIPEQFYHPPGKLGNMEIWYADVYDKSKDSVFVVQFTCGPDPLKKENVVLISFHAYTPGQGVTSLTRKIPPEEFIINEEPYQITLGKNTIRVYQNPYSHKTEYQIQANIEHILIDLIIEPVANSWLPFGEKVTFYDKKRKGIFSWIPSIPKGRVNGSVTIWQSTIKLTDAHGYYDHTFWETGIDHPFNENLLFWDDILVSWTWLKIIHDDIKIAINEFRFRPWLNSRDITTLMVCKDNSIMLSQNHRAQINRTMLTPDQPNIKADEFRLSFSFRDMNLKLDVTPAILLRYQDMLEYINPLSRSLVRIIFGSPVAFYTMARVNVNLSFGTENIVLNKAMALYESMVLSSSPSRFEDRIRKFVSRTISRRIKRAL